jgi:two-component system, NarL family, response regulator DevR
MAAAETLLLVGGQPVLLDAAEALLTKRGFSVLAKASSRSGALAALAKRPTDVVVLDLQMRGSEALDLLSDIRSRYPAIPVLVLAEVAGDARIQAALAEGAVGYVLKSGQPEDLVTAVRQARRRSVFFPMRSVEPAAAQGPPAGSELTPRELEILRLVADGLGNVQVAQKLWVTEQTVKFHLSNVYRKLGVSNRTEASRNAQLLGLLTQVHHASREDSG